MPAKNAESSTADRDARDLVLRRVFDAPRSLVFKAWTDPKHLAQWWGPRGFTNPVCEVDPRPGGEIRIDMRAPDGTVYPMKGVFREIVEPERLVMMTTAHADESDVPGLEVLTTVAFDERDGKTTLTVTAHVVKATDEFLEALEGMEQGWSESLYRLADLVSALSSGRK
jgi:uncharacterized protein YndB with AHSA1/START domain